MTLFFDFLRPPPKNNFLIFPPAAGSNHGGGDPNPPKKKAITPSHMAFAYHNYIMGHHDNLIITIFFSGGEGGHVKFLVQSLVTF